MPPDTMPPDTMPPDTMPPDAMPPDAMPPDAISTDAGIVRLLAQHAGSYRELMLEAYSLHPDAFTTSTAERQDLPLSWWQARLRGEPDCAQVLLGAFDGGSLCGAAGISFAAREKERHKATLFGMVVRAHCRRQGWGRRLVGAALACAASRTGVRHVRLTVTEGNAGAQRLYEDCGFSAFGLEPEAVEVGGSYLGKVHMWRKLHLQYHRE